ncbi:MAG: Lrp/AsnC ligand binding domain-containing protein [Gammaproteobacteria bacterium]|nr:Lrp/AsnC ligand binding domain-containing protein [Gammaproteobacteria bacterium]
MATAIVLLNVEPRETRRTAETIAAIDGVTEVYSVAGTFDLVAIVRVASEEKLADLVTEKIRAVPGILTSQTLIAFRAYSRFDLATMFEID